MNHTENKLCIALSLNVFIIGWCLTITSSLHENQSYRCYFAYDGSGPNEMGLACAYDGSGPNEMGLACAYDGSGPNEMGLACAYDGSGPNEMGLACALECQEINSKFIFPIHFLLCSSAVLCFNCFSALSAHSPLLFAYFSSGT